MDLNGKDLTLHQTVAVYSEEGQRAAQTGRSLFTEGTWGDGAVRVFSAPIWRDGKIIGVVQTAAPLAETRRAMAGVTRTLLLLMPAALLLAGLGGAFLTERSLRPVREITDAARNIGASNLTARLPVRGRDEFAQLAEMLNGMLGRIEDAFSRQKRFTADASHELKTPLSIIKVSSSMALEERMTPEEYQQSLRAIDRATDRANRVVQDLLLLARSDNGSLPLHPVTLSVEDVLDEARDSLPGSGVPITMDVTPGLVVRADRHHVARLLTNLLENARRHTPADGEILVAARRDGAFAEILVADTGEGIPAEHLPHIGEPFYRVDAARTRDKGGTGLGLAICRTIAQAHGGTLTVESTVGEGTKVRVHLPLASQDVPAAREEPRGIGEKLHSG
jgi:heavy metal sensor kinase